MAQGSANNRGGARKKKTETTPLPVWPFGSGVVVGIGLCLLVQLGLQSTPEVDEPPAPAATRQDEGAKGPKLDFYTRLKEVEVIVPSGDILVPEKNVRYFLQAGSYRQAKDADGARAQLILLNMDANISKFNLNGDIWHRVLVGPFESQSSVAQARTTLRENGIESLLMTEQIK